MFLISKFRVYLFYFLAVAAFILIGIHGYLTFSELDTGDALSIKYFAENFIFYIIVLLLILTTVFISALVKSNNIYKELEKVIELSRQGKYSSGAQLRKLGVLGDKIIEINARLNSLNEMKSLKISSLSNIVNFLLDKTEAAVLLLDAQGMITKVSRCLLEQLGVSEKDLLNKYAENIFDKFNFSNVMLELRKAKYVTLKSPLLIESSALPVDGNLIVFPIMNYKNEISNCICMLASEEELLKHQAVKKEIKSPSGQNKMSKEVQELPLFKRFSDLFH